MTDISDFKPDFDIIEEQPRDWTPFLFGIAGFLFIIYLCVRLV